MNVVEDTTRGARGSAGRLPGALTKLRTGIREVEFCFFSPKNISQYAFIIRFANQVSGVMHFRNW